MAYIHCEPQYHALADQSPCGSLTKGGFPWTTLRTNQAAGLRFYKGTQRERSRQCLPPTLESIYEGVYAVDEHWRIISMNRKAEEDWGRRRADLLGKTSGRSYHKLAGRMHTTSSAPPSSGS